MLEAPYQAVAPPITRRVRRTVRRIDPWSVLKASLVFYGSLMLILLAVGAILFMAATTAEIVDRIESFIQGIGWPEFRIRPLSVLRISILFGAIQVILWSAFNVFAAFLYNLAADLVGGVEVIMTEQEF
jgi:hypothetical protein